MMRSLIPDHAGDFTVEVSEEESAAITLTERNAFGGTTLAFTPEEARQVALFLLRAANAVEPEDIPLRLVASE